jgi:hypothetical protein
MDVTGRAAMVTGQRVGSCTGRSTAIQKTLRSIYYEHSWPIGERT